MKYTSQQMIQALKDGKSFWFYHISDSDLLYKATLVNGVIVVGWEDQQTAYPFDNGEPTCVDSWICTKIGGEETMTNKPHKHAELIKKWADGAVIQVKTLSGTWVDACDTNPFWEPNHEYRVKPTLVKKWKWVLTNKSGEGAFFELTPSYYANQEDWVKAVGTSNPWKLHQKIDSTMIEIEE